MIISIGKCLSFSIALTDCVICFLLSYFIHFLQTRYSHTKCLVQIFINCWLIHVHFWYRGSPIRIFLLECKTGPLRHSQLHPATSAATDWFQLCAVLFVFLCTSRYWEFYCLLFSALFCSPQLLQTGSVEHWFLHLIATSSSCDFPHRTLGILLNFCRWIL